MPNLPAQDDSTATASEHTQYPYIQFRMMLRQVRTGTVPFASNEFPVIHCSVRSGFNTVTAVLVLLPVTLVATTSFENVLAVPVELTVVEAPLQSCI